jgi:hypothetical protein
MIINQVVGNPPFSDIRENKEATNTNSLILYDQFVKKSCLVADDVVMVIPAGWTAKIKETKQFKDLGLYYVLFKPHTVFPTVYVRSGITVVYFKRGYRGDIKITTSLGESYTQPRADSITNMPKVEHDLIKRLKNYQNVGRWVQGGNNKSIPPSMRGSVTKLLDQYPTEYSLTATVNLTNRVMAWVNGSKGAKYVYTSRAPCRYVNKYKVVGALIAGVQRLGTILIEPPGVSVSGTAYQIICETLEEAELVRKYFTSDLVNFIINRVKFNDILVTRNNSWNHIPKPPIDQWLADGVADVNSAVNQWLALTPEEITLISDKITEA